MKKLTQSQIEQAVTDGKAALESNPEKTFALVYPLGFVANAYKWQAPAQRVRVTRDGFSIETYDQKRSGGGGPYLSVR